MDACLITVITSSRKKTLYPFTSNLKKIDTALRSIKILVLFQEANFTDWIGEHLDLNFDQSVLSFGIWTRNKWWQVLYFSVLYSFLATRGNTDTCDIVLRIKLNIHEWLNDFTAAYGLVRASFLICFFNKHLKSFYWHWYIATIQGWHRFKVTK
jgi:hypothetical protein